MRTPHVSPTRTIWRGAGAALGILAVALVLSACGSDSPTDGAQSARPRSAVVKPENAALRTFQEQLQGCAAIPADQEDVNSPLIVLNNPQFSSVAGKLTALNPATQFHTAGQDAWVMADIKTAQRAQALLAPYRSADSANKSIVADTTVIAFKGHTNGGVEDCITKTRDYLTSQGIAFSDAGQPAISSIARLTRAEVKIAKNAELIGIYCTDINVGAINADQPVNGAAKAHSTLRQFVPLLKRMPNATISTDLGDSTLRLVGQTLVAILNDYQTCVTAADYRALKSAL